LLSTFALADALTELNNRRALEWDLPKQIKKARTQGNPLSLVILDVDYFKKVNDTYGHLVGDRLLQLLCSCLRENLRFEDTPFRYGGEEFVVVLPKTTSEEALLVAERLNRVVNKQLFTIDGQLNINITISLGVACLQVDDDEQGFSLLNRADKCLLQAKATGRNQAILWEHLSHIPSLEAVSH
jgi:diguanylate cyclase (GGDEF)-like protein